MPALPVVFTRRAARQIEAASEWWGENRPAAPDAFRDDLVGALALIAGQPNCGAPMVSRRYRGVRRVLLVRLDHHLYYRLAPRLRQVQVLAFWHARRGSRPPL